MPYEWAIKIVGPVKAMVAFADLRAMIITITKLDYSA